MSLSQTLTALTPADEEGDYITVRNQSDLEEAITHTLETTQQTSLKLYLSTDQSPYPSLGSFNNNNDTSLSSSNSITSTSSTLNTATRRSSEMTSSHSSNRRSTEVTSPNAIKSKAKRVIRWQKGELLGEGGFGKVFLGMHTDTGELIAVKQVTIPRENADASAKVTALQKEIELMQDLDHENIVRYLGSERVEDKLNIFLEYQSGGSIATLLSKFKQFNEKIIRSFTKQILQGLKYLHDNGIAHRGKHVIDVRLSLTRAQTLRAATFSWTAMERSNLLTLVPARNWRISCPSLRDARPCLVHPIGWHPK